MRRAHPRTAPWPRRAAGRPRGGTFRRGPQTRGRSGHGCPERPRRRRQRHLTTVRAGPRRTALPDASAVRQEVPTVRATRPRSLPVEDSLLQRLMRRPVPQPFAEPCEVAVPPKHRLVPVHQVAERGLRRRDQTVVGPPLVTEPWTELRARHGVGGARDLPVIGPADDVRANGSSGGQHVLPLAYGGRRCQLHARQPPHSEQALAASVIGPFAHAELRTVQVSLRSRTHGTEIWRHAPASDLGQPRKLSRT